MASCKYFIPFNSFLQEMQTNKIFHVDGYTTDDVRLHWKEDNPVQVTSQTSITGFNLEKSETDICTSKTNTGKIHYPMNSLETILTN